MNQVRKVVCAAAAIGFALAATQFSRAVELDFVGSHIDLSALYPNGATPPCCIVPWRSDSPDNIFAVSDEVPNRYYGTAGYALFATRFDYPDQFLGYTGAVTDPIFAANDFFIDMIELPSFVTNAEILSSQKAAGWAYALIDDPVLQHGYQEWTFDGVNYPPAAGPCPGPNCNVTGGIPYVKLGLLTGGDVLGNNPGEEPTARWGFEVGEGAPETFRVGVMTDGLDADHFAAAEVFLTHLVDEVPVTTISSGQVSRNRFVDIHFFDITNAQAGDQFVFSAMKGAGDPDFANAGISGFTFDIVPTSTPGVPGDYNSDGEVNAADYTVWRDHLGQAFQLDNEGPDTPGSVTAEDYNFWKSQFGSAGSGALAAGVPEPGSIVLLMMAAGAVVVRRRRS